MTESKRPSVKSKTLQRRHIAALVAVGESLSVHAAARDMGMPQPALSRVLSDAEQLLGARLFERSSYGCTPTEAGQVVLAQARFVMRGLDELGNILSGTQPTVRLGCIPRAMYTLMPRLLNLVYPLSQATDEPSLPAAVTSRSFKLQVTEGSSIQLLQGLSAGKFDFAIFRSASSLPSTASDIVIERIYDDNIVVICAAENTGLGNKALLLRALVSSDWVLPDTTTTSRQAFDNFFREHGLVPVKPMMEVRSFEANLALVAGTRFLSIAPESIARRYVKMGLRIVRTKPTLPFSPVMLAYPRGEMSLGQEKFYQLLRYAAAAKPEVLAINNISLNAST
jgi:DNA-binding transcriptional LysR family regulator